MIAPPARQCDLFCRVVDNLGDIGVCWRLARQLAGEWGVAVRLFVDDVASLARIEPRATAGLPWRIAGVEVFDWAAAERLTPAPWVIEAFACDPPPAYLAKLDPQATPQLAHMTGAADAPPVWLNLEYLSAEEWVDAHHGLPSRHPRLGLDKFFFFPGFTPATGGLIRERALLAAHDAYRLEHGDAPHDPLRVLVFAYPHAPVSALIGDGCRVAAIGMENVPASVERLPMVPQTDFDRLLWEYDILFVRGEDSFVRAQWAAVPFVWHIYPQAGDAHGTKLRAFLSRYTAGLDAEVAGIVADLWLGWNGLPGAACALPDAWRRFRGAHARLAAHARRWSRQLAAMPDLASQLVTFCEARAKI